MNSLLLDDYRARNLISLLVRSWRYNNGDWFGEVLDVFIKTLSESTFRPQVSNFGDTFPDGHNEIVKWFWDNFHRIQKEDQEKEILNQQNTKIVDEIRKWLQVLKNNHDTEPHTTEAIISRVERLLEKK